jgi:hypothetical protein
MTHLFDIYNDSHSCKFFRACDPPRLLLDLSGFIIYVARDWTGEVVDVILGGKLYTSVILT